MQELIMKRKKKRKQTTAFYLYQISTIDYNMINIYGKSFKQKKFFPKQKSSAKNLQTICVSYRKIYNTEQKIKQKTLMKKKGKENHLWYIP